MMTKGKYHLALIGTDSLRAREIKGVLSRKNLPIEDISFFDPEGDEEYSKLTQFRDEPQVINPLSDDAIKEMDMVFLAADKAVSRKYGRIALKEKVKAIDLSEAFAGDKEVPVVVAGVNTVAVLKNRPILVANPHPVVIMLAHLFHVIRQDYRMERAVVSVLQPASAFDQSGIEELANQSLELLRSASLSKKVFKAQVAFNLLSQTHPVDKQGFSREEKQIVHEVREVLADSTFPLSLSLIQAPVFHSYALMTYVELAQDPELTALEELLKRSPYFRFSSPSRTCPVSSVSVAGKEQIFVGQLKKDEASPRGFWLWLTADNLTMGSALNAFEVAREMMTG